MQLLKATLAVFARIFLSLVFLVSGINQILYWNETEKRFLTVVADWQTYTVSSDWLQAFFRVIFQGSPFFLILISALQLLGAVLLLLGRHERLGALLLILVLIPTTLFVQHFWFSETGMRTMQFSFFLRDLGVLGGLLIVALKGTKTSAQSQ